MNLCCTPPGQLHGEALMVKVLLCVTSDASLSVAKKERDGRHQLQHNILIEVLYIHDIT